MKSSSGPSLTIRPARVGETDAVSHIRRDAILGLAPDLMSSEDAAAWAHRPGRAERTRASIEAGRLWVGLIDGEIVAWVELEQAYVAGLYVAPGLSRRGLGSALMDWAEGTMRERGLVSAHLRAAASAVSFYAKRGYVQCAPREPGRGTAMIKPLSVA